MTRLSVQPSWTHADGRNQGQKGTEPRWTHHVVRPPCQCTACSRHLLGLPEHLGLRDACASPIQTPRQQPQVSWEHAVLAGTCQTVSEQRTGTRGCFWGAAPCDGRQVNEALSYCAGNSWVHKHKDSVGICLGSPIWKELRKPHSPLPFASRLSGTKLSGSWFILRPEAPWHAISAV